MSRYQDAILKALATPRLDFKPSDIPNYLPAKIVTPIAFRHEILRLCEFRIRSRFGLVSQGKHFLSQR